MELGIVILDDSFLVPYISKIYVAYNIIMQVPTQPIYNFFSNCHIGMLNINVTIALLLNIKQHQVY